MIAKFRIGLLLTLCVVTGCTIAKPFTFIKDVKDPNQEVLVAVTHVVLGDDAQLNERFWDYVYRIDRELPNVEGALGRSMRKKVFVDEA